MRKKRSIKTEFEKVYMRFNEAKRDLKEVDGKDLENPHFIKSCKYITNKVYNINKAFFVINGVDYDDIYSLSVFYGACYLGYKSKDDAYDDKRYYLMMIGSIYQRLNRFVSWTAKKMQSGDITERLDIAIILHDKESLNGYELNNRLGDIKIDGIKMWGQEETQTLEEKLEDSVSSLELLEGESDDASDLRVRKARKKVKSIKKEIIKTKKEKNILFRSLKIKLNSDPSEYESKLIYYACTKHVSSDIRKVARRYCEKFGIDYKQKASSVIPQFDNKNYEIM